MAHQTEPLCNPVPAWHGLNGQRSISFAMRVASAYMHATVIAQPFVPSIAEIENAFVPLVADLRTMTVNECADYIRASFKPTNGPQRIVIAMLKRSFPV